MTGLPYFLLVARRPELNPHQLIALTELTIYPLLNQDRFYRCISEHNPSCEEAIDDGDSNLDYILVRQSRFNPRNQRVLTYPLCFRDLKCPNRFILPSWRFAVADGIEGHVLVLRPGWRRTSNDLLVRAHGADAVQRHFVRLRLAEWYEMVPKEMNSKTRPRLSRCSLGMVKSLIGAE